MVQDVEEAVEYLGLRLEKEAWAADQDLQHIPVTPAPPPPPAPKE